MKKSKFDIKKTIAVRSLIDSFRAIKENKLFFLLLVIGEIAFVALSALVLVYFSAGIAENAKIVFEPTVNMTSEGTMDIANIYDNPIEAYESYSRLKSDIFLFFALLLLIYLILNGVNWDFANLMSVKQDFMIYPVKFWVLTFLFLIPILIILRVITEISMLAMLTQGYVYLTFILIAVVIYFMRISYTFAVRYELKNIFEALKETFVFGVKKFYVYITVFAITSGLSIFSVYLIYLSTEANILLLTAALAFFILVLSWEKIYLMATTCNVVECRVKK